jgi:hypothetical protein
MRAARKVSLPLRASTPPVKSTRSTRSSDGAAKMVACWHVTTIWGSVMRTFPRTWYVCPLPS